MTGLPSRLADQRRIDVLADRFEEELRDGHNASIEDYLLKVAECNRTRLFTELLNVELEFRQGSGTSRRREVYLDRFPQFVQQINRIFDSARETIATVPPETVCSVDSLQIGSQVADRYIVRGELGRGGMGIVFKAWDTKLERFVAIKQISRGRASNRFAYEYAFLAQVNSNHVVRLYDADYCSNGILYICMEYVSGCNLMQKIRERQQPVDETVAIDWMIQACRGLRDIEGRGIVHRDLKPSNILVDTSGCVKVVDFGLARLHSKLDSPTRTSDLIGTPLYMAPEQAEDPRAADTRSDIYSLGATFFHVLTGRAPFDGKTSFAILYKHKTEPLVSPQSLNPQLSTRITEVIERCLAKSPEDRFRSFSEIVDQLTPNSVHFSPWEQTGADELGEVYECFMRRKSTFLDAELSFTNADATFSLGNGRVISVQRGNLADCRVDAVVSSDDEHLTMGGGVSWAIRRSAGPALEAQTRQYGPVRPGRAVVTSGGNLYANYIFHGITLGSKEPVSRDLIADIIRSCFYHADSLGVRSLAFPLLGTGIAGFSKEICLDTCFRVVAKLLRQRLTSVERVEIVVFDPELSREEWYRA